jgi:methionyl aminopeptidase
MFELLSDGEQAAMRRAGRAAAATLAAVSANVRAGVTTAAIDAWVRSDTAARGGHPAPLGYHGFPAAVCTSVNEVVCHGIPRDDVTLRDGDIVNVDVTTRLDGFHGDTSETLIVGGAAAASPEVRALVEAARACRAAGIAVVRAGARLGDVGAAIAEVARAAGMGVVREYGGHGIGRSMHAPPHVSHVGVRGTGARLRAGMCITIEPMLTLGAPAIRLLDDGWTVVTVDGRPSAQCEHTLLVTADGCEVLTAFEPSALGG